MIEEYKISDSINFFTDSWVTIANAVRNGNISNYNLGDTKEVDLGSLGKHNIRIANTSTPSECSTQGFSQTACSFVLEFTNIISSQAMNILGSYENGWPESKLYTYLNNDIYNTFSIDLKNIIVDTLVVSGYGNFDSNNFISTDKTLFTSTKRNIWLRKFC